MMHKFLKFFLLLTPLILVQNTSGQEIKSKSVYETLIQIFEESEVPLSIDHFDIIKDTIAPYDVRTFIDTNYKSFYRTEKKLDSSEFYSLFKMTDSLKRHNIWSSEVAGSIAVDKLFKASEFYPIVFFKISKNVYGFIIETGEGFVDKELFTIDNQMKIIDNLPLSFYYREGKFTSSQGGLWYPNMFSRITDSLTIEKFSGNSFGTPRKPKLIFKINKSGTIEKI